MEALEDRRLLTIDLVSGVSDAAMWGDAANGPSSAERAACTADGRYVAFCSPATNLISGDTNGVVDVFVKDTQAKLVRLASTDSDGQLANADCDQPALSADGRFLAFRSTATNLVADDTLSYSDIFLKNLVTGVTTRVSTTSTGAQAYDHSDSPVLSADGRYVVFCSSAANLVAIDGSVGAGIFRKDTTSGAVSRVSVNSTGVGADMPCSAPTVSSDGRYVVFQSEASNLVADDTNGHADVFLKDMTSGAIERVSTSSTGGEAHGDSEYGSLSADGRYVVFSSVASDLVTSDANGLEDVFLKDRTGGAVKIVSTNAAGSVQGNADADTPTITGDGTCVLFCSAADNLVSGDTNGRCDVFCRNLSTGSLTLISQLGTAQADADSERAWASSDGRYVVFVSAAGNLAAGDSNGADDVFWMDTQAGTLSLVSTRNVYVPGPFTAGGASDSALSISGDGRYVAFRSTAANLVEGDTNRAADVFVRDLQTGAVRLVSTGLADAPANGESEDPAISRDGRFVVFRSAASNLVEQDTNGQADIFVKNLVDGSLVRANTNTSGQQAVSVANYHPGDSDGPAISGDGRYVAFASYAANLVGSDSNGFADVFLKDLKSGKTIRVSTDTGGAEVNNASSGPAISNDGRYVAFQTLAAIPAPGDCVQLYVKDTWTDTTLRVSANQANVAANGDSDCASISDNGLIVFRSDASNLVDGDTNSRSDVFLRNLATGTVTLVSARTGGLMAGDSAAAPMISGDGRYVTFVGYASDLDSGNSVYKILVRDLQAGQTAVLSAGGEGAGHLNGDCYAPAISRYGTFVAFSSLASNLVAGDGNGTYDVFRVTNPLGNVAPTALKVDAQQVQENATTDTLVGTLATVDANQGDLFTYSLLNDAGGRFKIAGNQVQVADGSQLDYETGTTHVIRVRTMDQVQNSFEADITINVVNLHDTDGAALFDPAHATFYLHKENTTGYADYTFAYGDPTGGWQTMAGDWNGDGRDGVGLYDPASSMFYLTDAYKTGYAEYTFRFGDAGFTVTYTGKFAGENMLDTALALNTGNLRRGSTPVSASVVLATNGTPGNEKQKISFSTVPDAGTYTLTFDPDGTGPIVARTTENLSFNATAAQVQAALEKLSTIGTGSIQVVGNYGGFTPLVGDWDGDGVDGIGVYDAQSGTFRLTNTLAPLAESYVFAVGLAKNDWIPLVGDWNGDGASGVGLYDPQTSHFYLINSVELGFVQYEFGYGEPGWQPLVGDWDRDRADGVGLYNPLSSTFYLRNDLTMGFADHTIGYGVPDAGWKPVVGDWDGDNQMGIGLYDPSSSTYYLTNRLSSGYAETTLGFGQPDAGWQPLIGCWVTANEQLEPTPTSIVQTQSVSTTKAVDQLDLAGVAAYELQRLRTASLDESTDLFASLNASAKTIDEALSDL
jgi:hypothetical protein